MDDSTLKQDIIDELDFEPSIDAADIGVAVASGVVTLTGHVPTYGAPGCWSLLGSLPSSFISVTSRHF